MCDVHFVLKRPSVVLRYDGLLEKGVQDIMHFPGTSKLEWAVLLTDIQRAIRKHHNENYTITFDCASSFSPSKMDNYTYKMKLRTERNGHIQWCPPLTIKICRQSSCLRTLL